MEIQALIKKAKLDLSESGLVRPCTKWQGVELGIGLFEIFNQFYTMDIPNNIDELGLQSSADLPWAEDHFQERICGKPLNPGFQYMNWPYYRGIKNDELFRGDGSGDQFSHTYMERFWCKEKPDGNSRIGIRYEYGDFNDFIERFKNDPHGRQSYFSIWHPEDQSKGDRRLPCTLGYHFQVINNKLDCTYLIRSCDIFRHFHNDIYMTGRLMQYVVSKLIDTVPGLSVGSLHMWIGSLHCFEPERKILLSSVKKGLQ